MNRTYHHGDLRAALVEAGLALIEERAVEDFSLRELARRVGVSATAVYRHFPDKAALMSALAGEGLAKLAMAQGAASARAGGGRAGFSATGVAYVHFARENPGLFRMIFSHPAPQQCDDRMPDDATAMLRAGAAKVAKDGVDPAILALRAWSVVHGLAMLMLDRHISIDDATIAAVVDVRFFGGR